MRRPVEVVARSRVASFVLVLLAAGAIASMALRAGGVAPESDFRVLWLADRMWLAGGNPYGAGYRPFGIAQLGEWPAIAIFVYPPHLFVPTLPFGLLTMPAGLFAWNLAGVALGAVAAWLMAVIFARSGRERLVLAAAMILYLGLMTASGSALLVGQVSFVLLFAVALTGWAIARRRAWTGAIGMALMMLKPQAGIVLCCIVPFLPSGLRMTMLAALLVLVLSLPALAIGGVGPTVGGFVHNVLGYRSIDYNRPMYMTGLANPIEWLTGRDMSAIGMSIVGCLLAVGAIALLRRRGGPVDPRSAAATYLLLALGTTAGMVLLHTYDLVILSPLVVLALAGGARAALLLGGPLAIVARPENIGRLIDQPYPRIAAVGGVLLMIGCLILLSAKPRPLEH